MDTLRIYAVDDEPGMRLGVARALRDHRLIVPDLGAEVAFTIEPFESGEAALEAIEKAPPDLLLLDHKLPGISGIELLEKLQADNRLGQMLVVMITAYASLDKAVAAIKAGAFDFLAKPFTPADLKATIDKAAEKLVLAREARRLAREKHQTRFAFISVLAHELKAPLGAVEGFLNVIRQRAAGDDQAVYDHMLDRCSIRLAGMRKMIIDLLDLTRLESGKKQREMVQCDLREIARSCLETVQSEATERHITLNFDAGDEAVILADRGEMEIILNNLITNSVKYNRDGGHVDITLKPTEENMLLIQVTDTGIGLTKEEADRLFGDFVRIKNDKTRNILGSGLGLSIVKKLAMAYGGTATVESEPDVGSTFRVTLKRDGSTIGSEEREQSRNPEMAS